MADKEAERLKFETEVLKFTSAYNALSSSWRNRNDWHGMDRSRDWHRRHDCHWLVCLGDHKTLKAVSRRSPVSGLEWFVLGLGATLFIAVGVFGWALTR